MAELFGPGVRVHGDARSVNIHVRLADLEKGSRLLVEVFRVASAHGRDEQRVVARGLLVPAHIPYRDVTRPTRCCTLYSTG
eukprot:4488016-Pleurochrysis_carterae.AAC.3